MQIEVTCGLGDTVYTLVKRNKIVTCAVCSSTGKVTLGGEEFACPKCQGRLPSEKELVAEAGTIQKITAIKCSLQCKARYTILRSGRAVVVDEDHVYASKALAEAAIPAG